MCSPTHKRCTDLTSSFLPDALRITSCHIKKQQGLRPLKDLTKHFKARTDDGHASTDINKLKINAIIYIRNQFLLKNYIQYILITRIGKIWRVESH